ncbi:DUF1444 family protein [Leptospira barantonii]|uniref:DUF1444 family protein n=1 Tax=Leptospira barantonii TaxID=2023184 RepID=A0A5F2BAQ7_9LEPT|nr:DUF1444 family protein [Leptospira barantonii]TGM01130.1 DUF1444 family protein [Leptospira barantonii]
MNRIFVVLLTFCLSLGAESKIKFDEKEFQNLVVTVLEKRISDVNVRKADDKRAVYINEIEYSLSNLYRLYRTSTGNDEELIFDHFEKAIRMTENQPKSALSWEKAKTILMPQIIRQEYAKENRIYQGRIFGNDLVVSFVLNYKDGYRYVLEENQTSWNVSEEELFRNAIDNLDRISRNVKFLKVNSGILAIRMQDSYDATRILLPKLRERIAKRLGNDFEFALPKRDFLICWSRSLPEDVKIRLAEQVDSDFQSGAYSISKEVFVGSREGIRGR